MPEPKPYVARDGARTWRVRFRLAGRQTSETFPNLRAAEIFCRDLESHGAEYATGLRERDDEDRKAPALDDVAAQFFAWKRGRVVSDRTVVDYERDYRNWIRPTLGGKRVTAITEAAVQEWIDAMHAGTLGRAKASPKSIGDRHALLHAIFDYACHPSRKLATHNPCLVSSLPKRPPRRVRGLTPAEWQAIHAALTVIDQDAADLALFMVASGWRWSEASALDTHSVEIDPRGMVHVTMRQVARRRADSRTEIVTGAKSQAGMRRIALDADASAMVARRVAEAEPGGLVFTAAGRQWQHHHFRYRRWVPACKAANLNRLPTPHEMRHTQAGWLLISKKASLQEVQKRLGHKSIATTVDIYGSLVSDVDDAALDALAAMRRPALPSIGQIRGELA